MLFLSCVCHAFVSVHYCLVVICWKELTSLLLLLIVFLRDFATFPCGILGQVWYLIVSIPDLCRLSYFGTCRMCTMSLYKHAFAAT